MMPPAIFDPLGITITRDQAFRQKQKGTLLYVARRKMEKGVPLPFWEDLTPPETSNSFILRLRAKVPGPLPRLPLS